MVDSGAVRRQEFLPRNGGYSPLHILKGQGYSDIEDSGHFLLVSRSLLFPDLPCTKGIGKEMNLEVACSGPGSFQIDKARSLNQETVDSW